MKYREIKDPVYIRENKRYRVYSERVSYTFFGVPEGGQMGGQKFEEILSEPLPEIMKDIQDSRSPMNLKHDKKKYTFRYIILKLQKKKKTKVLKVARKNIDYLKRGKSLTANFSTVAMKAR